VAVSFLAWCGWVIPANASAGAPVQSLSPQGRARHLLGVRAQVRAAGGERDPRELAAGIARAVEAAGMKVDYVELVHPETLRPAERAEPGTRALVAAFLGRTRLIDNLALP